MLGLFFALFVSPDFRGLSVHIFEHLKTFIEFYRAGELVVFDEYKTEEKNLKAHLIE